MICRNCFNRETNDEKTRLCGGCKRSVVATHIDGMIVYVGKPNKKKFRDAGCRENVTETKHGARD